jgi:hypothetical protein
MQKTTYIQTDANTANLAELLKDKLVNYEHIINELVVKVGTLTNPLDYSQLFAEKQAAERLSIFPLTLARLRKKGDIHYRLVGNSIRYSLGDIMEYEERCKR